MQILMQSDDHIDPSAVSKVISILLSSIRLAVNNSCCACDTHWLARTERGTMLYLIDDDDQGGVTETTFKDLGKKESDVEELLRNHVELICDDDDSLIVVGQQVRNEENGRSDLTALDGDGNIVLIEIKRDVDDIKARHEAFEFQAIRYAASCATINSIGELVQDVYAPYVEKHKDEYSEIGTLTSAEVARRKIDKFMKDNDARSFNDRQRIILVASDFDAQTLSAVAWLDANGVDIACYRLTPFQIGINTVIHSTRVLPLATYDDFYVQIKGASSKTSADRRDVRVRQHKPRIDALIDHGVVKAGVILAVKNQLDQEVELQQDGQVKLSNGEIVGLNSWLKKVKGWSSVDVYEWAIDKLSGKTLDELRSEWMESQSESEID